MKRKRRKAWLFFLVGAAMLAMFVSELKAAENIEFHGYLESNIVLRDEDGAQYGFLDHLNAVQQRNTLKFDVDVKPGLAWGDLSFDKVHLTYRGAYDSIFDLRAGHFDNISDKGGPTRFDYGVRDIRFENDLREATLDFVYNGPLGSAFFRPGRQIVSWGESSPAVTLLDVINPSDNSYQLFFQNPDDVKIPLWMGRLNYSIPRFMAGFAMNFDFLWIPDIRPSQFGPRDINGQPFGPLSVAFDPTGTLADSLMQAPYTSILFGGLRGFGIREEVPTEQQEYGIKAQANIGERLSVSAVYFRDVINDPGVVLRGFTPTQPLADALVAGGAFGPGPFPPGFNPLPPAIPTLAVFTHDVRNVYGGYFSYQFQPLDVIIRGEYSHYTESPISVPQSVSQSGTNLQDFDFAVIPGVGPVPTALRTFRMKPVNKWMLAVDKNYLVKWIAPHQNTMFSFEWDHTRVNGWESDFDAPDSTVAKDQDVFQLTIIAQWFEGRLNPMFVAAYIPGKGGDGGGTGMIHPVITWNITPHLYANAGLQAFFGDKEAVKSGFAGFVNGTSEVTLKIGYEW